MISIDSTESAASRKFPHHYVGTVDDIERRLLQLQDTEDESLNSYRRSVGTNSWSASFLNNEDTRTEEIYRLAKMLLLVLNPSSTFDNSIAYSSRNTASWKIRLPAISSIANIDVKREIERLSVHDGDDNDGVEAPSAAAVAAATALADDLPLGITRPDICTTPKGEIDLTWFVSGGTVSLSIGPDGSDIVLTATLDDGREYSGCEPWIGNIPATMKCCLIDLCKQ